MLRVLWGILLNVKTTEFSQYKHDLTNNIAVVVNVSVTSIETSLAEVDSRTLAKVTVVPSPNTMDNANALRNSFDDTFTDPLTSASLLGMSAADVQSVETASILIPSPSPPPPPPAPPPSPPQPDLDADAERAYFVAGSSIGGSLLMALIVNVYRPSLEQRLEMQRSQTRR